VLGAGLFHAWGASSRPLHFCRFVILIIAQVHVLLSFSIAVSLFIEWILTREHTLAEC